MRTEQIDQLTLALSKAQRAFLPIVRNRTATVSTDKGSYEYSYATLDRVIDAITDALADNELAHFAVIVDGKLRVSLAHSSGQEISNEIALPDPAQVGWARFGTALTYARRYGLTPLVGVFNEDDDDVNNEGSNKAIGRTDKPDPVSQLWNSLGKRGVAGPAALVWCEERTHRNVANPRELTAEELQMLMRVAEGREAERTLRPKATATQIDQLNTALDTLQLVSPPDTASAKEVAALKKAAKLAWLKEKLGRTVASARDLFGDESDRLLATFSAPKE